jgi:drug/metabolite transporter (DMT)-like permease
MDARTARDDLASTAHPQGQGIGRLLRLGRIPAGVLGGAFLLLWCTGYPAARVGLDHSSPFTLLMLRFGSAGVIYALLAQLAGVWPRGRAALHSAVVGSLSLAGSFGALYYAAAAGVNVGICALVIGTMPIMTALFGLPFGERVRSLQWLGFALGFAGVALTVGKSVSSAGGGAGLFAYLALLGGLVALSAGTVYQKRLGSTVDLRGGLAVQHLTATVLLLPLALREGLRFDVSAPLLASLGWLVGVNSLAAFALFFVLLKRGAVNRVATLFFLMPPVTAVLDYFVLGDALGALQVAGLALAALGVYLATRPSAAEATEARTADAPARVAARAGAGARPARGRRRIGTPAHAAPRSCAARGE